MDTLIPALKERYDTTVSKIGRDFIIGICNYLDLFSHPEIQKILETQKQLPKQHYHNFLGYYQKLIKKVYEPMKTKPENAEWKFYGFWDLYEEDKGHPFMIAARIFSWKAYFWDRGIYTARLTNLHNRLLILLNNKIILPENQSKSKVGFDVANSVLKIGNDVINIDIRKSGTNQHKVLKYIFEHMDKHADFFKYSDIAEFEFNDKGYLFDPDSHRRYYTACDKINAKVSKKTQGKIADFLEFHSGDKGFVRINPKYL
ncbi:MAG: hypothetical protein P4L74_06900 [Candidatus Doudnabacteria bacterium]|nr:hypothetical protein [Candidatus Doudnabacteria bacterium]